jgi:CDP-diacylglycerol--glycerol-3-phosphate 3-phosphatidyltransferase
VAAGQGIVISASGWGKAKMFTQVTAVSILILALRHEHFVLPGKVALWVVVAIALLSGADYFSKFLRQVASVEGPPPSD